MTGVRNKSRHCITQNLIPLTQIPLREHAILAQVKQAAAIGDLEMVKVIFREMGSGGSISLEIHLGGSISLETGGSISLETVGSISLETVGSISLETGGSISLETGDPSICRLPVAPARAVSAPSAP